MRIDEYITNSDVDRNHTEDLAEYILRICKENDLSFTGVEKRAKKRGFLITQSYVSRIVSGAAQNVSVEKLKALAAGLDRPEDEVFAVARGQTLETNKINDAVMGALAFNYGKLTKKDREAIAPLLRALQREIDERLEKGKE